MPKRVFWPLTLVIMGLIFLASNLRLLPQSFWNLWPLILVVVGLGGLVTSDQEDWQARPVTKSVKTARPVSKAKPAARSSKPAAKKRKK